MPEYIARNINHSPARQRWITTFDGWIRATYQPMGAIAIPFREIYPEAIRQPYIPLQFGIDEQLYAPIVRGGKLTRTPSPHFGTIGIFANALPGHDPAALLNVPDQGYAFTMAWRSSRWRTISISPMSATRCSIPNAWRASPIDHADPSGRGGGPDRADRGGFAARIGAGQQTRRQHAPHHRLHHRAAPGIGVEMRRVPQGK